MGGQLFALAPEYARVRSLLDLEEVDAEGVVKADEATARFIGWSKQAASPSMAASECAGPAASCMIAGKTRTSFSEPQEVHTA